VTDPGGYAFAPGDPPQGVCWSPTNNTLDASPTWIRMDDPTGSTRYVTGWQITRGRNSELDKTQTGTATVSFRDLTGRLDPTNISGPWYGNLDPMKQAAIALQNPITGAWHTLFRGFVAGPDMELEAYRANTGINDVTWNLVDAFDLFANVVLTPGKHGETSLTSFPNIYYPGTPNNIGNTFADTFVHVDDRIVKLLDDAGWPKDTVAPDPKRAGLRNIFSGNVSVQGSVYARQDSLLQALEDACDAEFPCGVSNHWISKAGVYTFHGRYARFNPTNPGYGINHWYVGGQPEAETGANVAPLAGPIRFYRSKDDIYNSSLVVARNIDPTTSGVVVAADTTSQGKYGYRSLNFEELLISQGHDSANNPTSMIVECNRFADYVVGNYKTPQTRVQTLRFRPSPENTAGAAALWNLMTRVELGDQITVKTTHPGGGGFNNVDFFVEQIRYDARPSRTTMHDITLELEVSPASFYAYNPFGTGA
jgi:hypothetical protein